MWNPRASAITPTGRDGPLPLSFDQERLWFLHRLNPTSGFYNLVALSCRLRGALDGGALRQALAEVVRRHEALRTVFPARDGRPEQEIAAPGSPPAWLSIDLAQLAPAARAAESAAAELAAAAAAPFDLARGPLLRALLFRLASDDHLFLVVAHHIVFDGSSIGILRDELAALYAAGRRRTAAPLAPLAVQPVDVAAWQRRQLAGPLLDGLLAFWRRQLAGSPSLFDLPTDRPRPAVQRFRGARQETELGWALGDEVHELCRGRRVTPFMLLLAAFAALLSRIGGGLDVPLATPVAGRDRPETQGLIGFFVNTLVLRLDLAGRPSFGELLERVRDVCLDALDHQEMPFARLVEELDARRDLSHNPLFQIVFSYLGDGGGELSFPGVTCDALDTGAGAIAKFDLLLTCAETDAGLVARLEHDTDLFTAATALRLLAGFRRLLEAALAAPAAAVEDLPLLGAAERHQLLVEWNDTGRPYPRTATLDQLFGAQARRAPDAVALCHGDAVTTYAALERWADRLAGGLRRALGPGAAEAPVGILAERSAAAVAGLLAALKAGALYVPLDPAQPAERLAALVRAAGLRAVLVQRGLLPAGVFDGPCVPLDAPRAAGDDEVVAAAGAATGAAAAERAAGAATETPEVDAAALAYVMFTSGSTGQPKGIGVPHRAVVRLVCGAGYVDFGPREVFLQLAPLAFDAATFEIWGALLHGARLVVAPPAIGTLGETAALLARHGVTTLWLTAGLFHQMVQDEPASLAGVRQLLAGGDVLAPSRVRAAAAGRAAGSRLVNGYGPTEATTFACCQTIGPAELGLARVPIGRPIAQARAYLCGRGGEPVPIGAAGELWIGGDGLARGYWRQPAATAERFRPNPCATPAEAGSRLYATGDLARFLPDGRLDFLRRADAQLKVRGFRIEPEEIEAALVEHPAIAAAAVLLREAGDAARGKILVACLTARGRRRPRPAEVREFLRRRLPDYMLPAALLWIDEVPLNANGKVDRRAVAERTADLDLAIESERTAPRNDGERLLLDIWQRVLGRTAIGVHDNFFDLGGDSLLAIQVVSRAAQAGLPLQVSQLFRQQTLAELAAAATGTAAAAEQGWVTGPVPFTPGQRWFFDRIAGGLTSPHAFSTRQLLELRQALTPGAVRRVVERVAFQHDALRLRLHRAEGGGGDGGWRQSCGGPEVLGGLFACLDLGGLDAARQDRALAEAARRLLALPQIGDTPLARFVLLPRGPGAAAWLLIQLHHLVSDAASWRILLEDLEAAAVQAAAGAAAIQLPPKTTSFRTWAERQVELAASPELRREAADWLRLAAGATHPLPVDGDGAESADGAVDSVEFGIDSAATLALVEELPAAHGFPFTHALLAALARGFRRWSGAPALLLRQTDHGRNPAVAGVDLSRTVGWISTTAPVALRLGDGEPAGDALAAIDEQLANVPLRGLGYGLLRYLSDDPAIVAGMAGMVDLPAATFNFLGRFDQSPGAAPRLLEPASLGVAGPPPVPYRAPQLRISGLVSGGPPRELLLSIAYARDLYRRETIARLAALVTAELERLIAPAAG